MFEVCFHVSMWFSRAAFIQVLEREGTWAGKSRFCLFLASLDTVVQHKCFEPKKIGRGTNQRRPLLLVGWGYLVRSRSLFAPAAVGTLRIYSGKATRFDLTLVPA